MCDSSNAFTSSAYLARYTDNVWRALSSVPAVSFFASRNRPEPPENRHGGPQVVRYTAFPARRARWCPQSDSADPYLGRGSFSDLSASANRLRTVPRRLVCETPKVLVRHSPRLIHAELSVPSVGKLTDRQALPIERYAPAKFTNPRSSLSSLLSVESTFGIVRQRPRAAPQLLNL